MEGLMKKASKISILMAVVLTFSSCSFNVKNNPKSKETVKVEEPGKFPTSEEVVSTLCSEEFQGRMVGTKGNEKTCDYIEKYFKMMNLEPIFDNTYRHKYYQEVAKEGGNENDTEIKMMNNLVGVIKGKNNEYNKKAVVISAHFDHVGHKNGQLIPGALDNASGTAVLLEVANLLSERAKTKPFNMDIIFCAFNGEEFGLQGSGAFVNDVRILGYTDLYNINIDCVGSKSGGKIALKNISKVSNKLYKAMKDTMTKDKLSFADTRIKGSSDHASFEREEIPNIYIGQEGINKLVHKPTDTKDTLNYDDINKISKVIFHFVENNDGIRFQQ